MARRGENIYHRRDGREVKEKLQKAKENAMLPAADSMTVEQFMNSWLSDRQLSVKPSTDSQYRKLTDLYVLPYLGSFQAADLTVQKITDYVQMLSVSGIRDAAHGLSASTIRSVLTIIRSAVWISQKWQFRHRRQKRPLPFTIRRRKKLRRQR